HRVVVAAVVAGRFEPLERALDPQLVPPGLQRPVAVGPDGHGAHRLAHPDEFAARVAALLQPVGVDQAQPVVLRLLRDRPQEPLLSPHRPPPPNAKTPPPGRPPDLPASESRPAGPAGCGGQVRPGYSFPKSVNSETLPQPVQRP